MTMRKIDGDIKTALDYLETAIEMGFSDFPWLDIDPDLANVRESNKY